MSTIYDMAKQLGGAIARTDEYQTLKRTMDAVGDDREMVEMRNRLEELEGRDESSLRAGEAPDDEIKEAYQEATEALQSMTGYQRLIAAQSNYEKVMHKVNQTVAEGIEEGSQSRIILS